MHFTRKQQASKFEDIDLSKMSRKLRTMIEATLTVLEDGDEDVQVKEVAAESIQQILELPALKSVAKEQSFNLREPNRFVFDSLTGILATTKLDPTVRAKVAEAHEILATTLRDGGEVTKATKHGTGGRDALGHPVNKSMEEPRRRDAFGRPVMKEAATW